MPRYTDDSKEKVRNAVDFFDLVGRYTDLRRAGPGQMTGLCPFHEERTPSFRVHEEYFKCFGCGEAGDVFKFVQLKEGLDFVAALEWLADRFGIELEVADEDPAAAARREARQRLIALLERTAVFYARMLWESPEAAGAREYLAGRGLDEALLREFRVGYSPSAWDKVLLASRRAGFSEAELYDAGLVQRNAKTGSVYDRFRGRIMFPLCDRRGKVLGFGARKLGEGEGPKYLNSPENVVFHKGQNVYAADIARVHAARAGQVILCEGYTDVIALHQAQIRNAVGLMGTALTPEQVVELQRLAPTVLLALDADAAGQEAMLKASQVAAGRGVELRVIPLPDGKDPADLVGAGVDVRQLTERSIPFVRFRVERVIAGADVSRAEGKDRAVEQLKPVLGSVGQGALRNELINLAADRLDIATSLLEQMLGAAPVVQREQHAPVQAPPPRAEDDPIVQAERAFLAACLAAPDAGRELLTRLDLDDVLTVPLHRRAAAHIRAHGDAHPGEDLEPLVADLVLRAGARTATRATLDAELKKLRLAVHDRRMQHAPPAEKAQLAAERPVLKREVDDAIARALGDE